MRQCLLLGCALIAVAAPRAGAQSSYGGVVVEPRWQAGEPLVAVVQNYSKLPVRIASATVAIPLAAGQPDCVVDVPIGLTVGPAETVEVLPEARQAIANCLGRATLPRRGGPQRTLAVRESTASTTARSAAPQPVHVRFALEVNGRPVELADAWRVSP